MSFLIELHGTKYIICLHCIIFRSKYMPGNCITDVNRHAGTMVQHITDNSYDTKCCIIQYKIHLIHRYRTTTIKKKKHL